MNAFRLLFLSLTISLAACSTPDNSEPPAELIKIENAEYVKLLWSKDSGKGAVNKYINMQPFVNENKIYTIDTLGLITRMDAVTGKVDWSYDSGLLSVTGLTGTASMLVASSRNGEVMLFDYDDKSITQRWKHQLKSEIRTKSIVDERQVFIRSVDGKLTALNARNGDLQWAISRRVPALSLTGSSSPVITHDTVISGFDNGRLVAFSRDKGSIVWEHTVSAPKGRTEIERLVDLDGQFILRDNIIYIGSFHGNLIAIALDSGQVLWTRKFSSFKAIDADNEALYLTDDKSHVWSIDRRTGSAFWKQDIFNARKLTAPRIVGDKLVVADLEGYVHWMNKSDGTVVARIQSSDIRYISQPLIIDTKVIVIDTSGQLSVLTQDKTIVPPLYSTIRFRH